MHDFYRPQHLHHQAVHQTANFTAVVDMCLYTAIIAQIFTLYSVLRLVPISHLTLLVSRNNVNNNATKFVCLKNESDEVLYLYKKEKNLSLTLANWC